MCNYLWPLFRTRTHREPFKIITKSVPERRPVPSDAPHAQDQSVLFSQLPAEVRLLIYDAVLADEERLLHILRILPRPKTSKTTKLTHWRCNDMDSLYPEWQHTCYRDCVHTIQGQEMHSNDNLLSLLLTCRRV